MRRLPAAAALIAATLLHARPADALWLDRERTARLSVLFSVQASWRTSDPEAFTQPRIPAGNLVQNRFVFDAEIEQNLVPWVRRFAPGLSPADFRLGYLLRVKPTYDGAYDYGPSQLTNSSLHSRYVNRSLRILRRHKFQHDAFPWNAYVDVGYGRVSLRAGRQVLSWGETDGFRLLDVIVPNDNRFGFPLVEDLDDRRIPLWMLRAQVDLPEAAIGPFANLVLDGYWVPGGLEDQESPIAESASPFTVNQPYPHQLLTVLQFNRPPDDLGGSRGGARIVGTLLDAYTFSLAHYYTWTDVPGVNVRLASVTLDPSRFTCDLAGDTAQRLSCILDVVTELNTHPIQVSGGSLSGALPFDPLTILRTEVAMFWGEAVEEAEDLSFNTLSKFAVRELLTGERDLRTDTHNRHVLRWMVGFDRNLWLRWLNRRNSFLISAQYFHSHILRARSNQVTPALHPQHSRFGDPTSTDTILDVPDVPTGAAGLLLPVLQRRYQEEVFFTWFVTTEYWNARIRPSFTGAYDIRGVYAVVPGVTYQAAANLFLDLKYANVFGGWHLLGLFRDRDVFFARIRYYLT